MMCLDCFRDTQRGTEAEFTFEGASVCRVHLALRLRRVNHGNLPKHEPDGYKPKLVPEGDTDYYDRIQR